MPLVVLGLLLGVAASAWVATAAHDRTLATSFPNPWLIGFTALGVLAIGWVMANVVPRFAAALAGAAAPGAAYGAMMLAGDDARSLAYGWALVALALACVALGAGFRASRSHSRPWSARRSTASRVPRMRTR